MPENLPIEIRAVIALLVLMTGLLGSLGLGYLTSRILKASNGRILILGYFALAILGVSVSIGPMVVLVYMFFDELKAGGIPLVGDYPLATSICVFFYYGILWAAFRAGAGRTGGVRLMAIGETLFSLIAFVVVSVVLYLYWRWLHNVPELPKPPFWSRSKLVALGVFAAVYIPFVIVVPQEELDLWGHSIGTYGWWSMLLILFPEINRQFVSRLTLDNMMSVDITRGLGWALLIVWSLVTAVIVIGFLL